MNRISKKTISDLEFDVVLQQTSEYCITDDGRSQVVRERPIQNREQLIAALSHTHEFVSSYSNENRIPKHGFDSIDKELQLLGIENSVLNKDSIRKVAQLPRLVNEHIKFLKKFKELYPQLYQRLVEMDQDYSIPDQVDMIIDRFGEIKDDASADLKLIRTEIKHTQHELNGSFTAALQHYIKLDYLDEIRESVVDNRRVLAVRSMHRRKIKGKMMGSSKTGTISYIEPERVLRLSRKLSELESDEAEEINAILKELTNFIRPYIEPLQEYKVYLTETDVIYAKSKYALRINGILPKIVDNQEMELIDAYHPLLMISNNERGKKTYPQSIHLNKEKRILVISGPNAGGKSITLKTVGLLQLMLQTGMLLPIHEHSRVCFFNSVLTDIGDNQSIDNHLSTYSYRLKNMKGFLRKADSETLFLIDEFGTGSDPELGGALAEAMLEELYSRGSYGIITTHYTNLKFLANQLPHMLNANMLFDSKSLEPVFKLHIGEAGSSFTFEVAQKNGIPYSLINKAKKKVERGKIRFDKSIAALQKERSNLRKTTDDLRSQEMKSSENARKLEVTQERIQQKLEDFQQLYDDYQKYIHLGRKFDQLSDQFYRNNKKRLLLDELMKMVITENVKRKPPVPKKEKSKLQGKKKQLENEVLQKTEKIRKEKKIKKKNNPIEVVVKKDFKINDKVRLIDSRSVGTIDSIEKDKVVINYGMFTTQASVDQIEFVK